MTRACKLLFLPVLFLQAGFFWYVSQHRLIDGDEGFYVLASRLVLHHKTPYLDFFYQQTPLLPYLYAFWLKFAGISWFSARTFSALLTAMLGAVIYVHVCRETEEWLAALAAMVLFTSSNLVFAWLPIAKPFGLSALFLFLSYAIVARPSPTSSVWLMALAGIAFGLSVDARSYVVGVAAVFLWWIWSADRTRRTARLLCFAGGVIIGLAPCLILFFASPDAFLFNNLGYHAVRTVNGLIGDWWNKAKIVWYLFTGFDTGFQFSTVVVISAALLLFGRLRRNASLLAFLIALLLGVICLLPTPSALQYFSMVMPFLIVATICLVSEYVAGLHSFRAVTAAGTACVLLVASFVGFGIPSFRGYLSSGEYVPGIAPPAYAPNWTLPQVTAVSAAIDSLSVPGEEVLSFWPGYIFASWADPYPEFENHFGMTVSGTLTADKRQKYHLISELEIHATIASHKPRLVVVGNQGRWIGGADYYGCIGLLQTAGYKLVRTMGNTHIYECCAAPR